MSNNNTDRRNIKRDNRNIKKDNRNGDNPKHINRDNSNNNNINNNSPKTHETYEKQDIIITYNTTKILTQKLLNQVHDLNKQQKLLTNKLKTKLNTKNIIINL